MTAPLTQGNVEEEEEEEEENRKKWSQFGQTLKSATKQHGANSIDSNCNSIWGVGSASMFSFHPVVMNYRSCVKM